MMPIHLSFDLLALGLGVATSYWFRRTHQLSRPIGVTNESHYHIYLLVIVLGLIGGGLLFGTLNLALSGKEGFAKSLIGALLGAIAGAEITKYILRIKGSTGLYFVPGLVVVIIVGRIGCFAAGLPDFTYGTETDLPWAVDFGDGVGRHPVQLYESLSMAAFLGIFLATFARHRTAWEQRGFYWMVMYYAGQRFIWEYLKPYASVVGNLNLFQLISLVLVAYSATMLARHGVGNDGRTTT